LPVLRNGVEASSAALDTPVLRDNIYAAPPGLPSASALGYRWIAPAEAFLTL